MLSRAAERVGKARGVSLNLNLAAAHVAPCCVRETLACSTELFLPLRARRQRPAPCSCLRLLSSARGSKRAGPRPLCRGRPPDSPDPEKTGRTRSTAGVELKIHSGFSPGVRRPRSRKGAGGGGSGRPLRGGAALAGCAQRGRAGSSESQVKVDEAALCEPPQGKVKRKSRESQAKVKQKSSKSQSLSENYIENTGPEQIVRLIS